MAKNKKVNHGVAIGVGLGMLAAMSAGAYYLYGTKEGAKKRVKIRGWVIKAKGEMMEKLETLKEVNQGTYSSLVDVVMKKYQGVKSIDKKEVDALVEDLKKHWGNIKKHLNNENVVKSKVRSKSKAVKKVLEK